MVDVSSANANADTNANASADTTDGGDGGGGGGNKSWMSLCLAATKLMDEKAQSDDATTDPEDEEDNAAAVNNLLCFETIGGGLDDRNIDASNNHAETDPSILSDPTVMHAIKEAKRRKKDIIPSSSSSSSISSMMPTKRHKSLKPTRYIRGVPAISKRDIAWNVMFKRLQEFKHEYGHCNVPQGFTTDLELATWVKNQRQAYRYMLDNKSKDKKPTKRISPDRVTRLNHLGFEWRKYVRADDWADHYFGKRTTTPRQKMATAGRGKQEAVTIPPSSSSVPLAAVQSSSSVVLVAAAPAVASPPPPQPYETTSEEVNNRIPMELLCEETL